MLILHEGFGPSSVSGYCFQPRVEYTSTSGQRTSGQSLKYRDGLADDEAAGVKTVTAIETGITEELTVMLKGNT